MSRNKAEQNDPGDSIDGEQIKTNKGGFTFQKALEDFMG
jgi:hypothetical protein